MGTPIRPAARRHRTINPGFHTTGLLALGVQLPPTTTTAQGETSEATANRSSIGALALLDRLSAIPGVAQAALASDLPLGGASAIFYAAEGQGPEGERTRPRAYVHRVTPGFVDAIGLRLVHGRDFHLYFPFNDTARGFAAVLRANGSAADLTAAARDAIRRADPQAAVTVAETIESRVNDQLASVRFLSWLTGTFATLAFTLSVIGIYAVLAHTVRKRRREIGIRSALGAPAGSVVTLVVTQGVMLVSIGLVVGVVLSMGLSRGIKSWLFGVSAVDRMSYASVAAVVLTAAIAASLVPALRAARIDPMIALRNH
jgi:hypothetical protein